MTMEEGQQTRTMRLQLGAWTEVVGAVTFDQNQNLVVRGDQAFPNVMW